MKRVATCALLMFATLQLAQAGRPIETDDASAAEFRTCQLDFWTESSRELRQDNFNGGCNLLGQGEFSLGLGRVHGNQEDQLLSSLGYKHIFKTLRATLLGSAWRPAESGGA